MQFRGYISLFVFLLTIFFIVLGFKESHRSKKSKIRIKLDYASAPIIGVLILICTFSIDLGGIFKGVIGTEEIQPYAIIILFMSSVYMLIIRSYWIFWISGIESS